MMLSDVIVSVLDADSGGQEEALGHYEDATRAIFDLQLNCHSHIQSYRSTKDGKVKWASINMWPMPVSIHWLLPLFGTAHCFTSVCTQHPLFVQIQLSTLLVSPKQGRAVSHDHVLGSCACGWKSCCQQNVPDQIVMSNGPTIIRPSQAVS